MTAALAIGLLLAACSGDDDTLDDASDTTIDAIDTPTTPASTGGPPSTTTSPTTTTTSATNPTNPPSTTGPVEPAEHRIGVRVGADGGEFYDRTTGETWVPRGFNHWQWDLHNGYLMDRTFRAGDNDLEQAKADLADMADLGYNAVRIWASACFEDAPGCMVGPDGEIRPQYIANIAEYLRAAKEHGLVVMFTVDDLVGPVRWESGRSGEDHTTWGGFNLHDLTPGGIDDQLRFWDDLVGGLIEVGAPLDAVWSWQLRNEQFFEANMPPFGAVDQATAANGTTYDLTDPAEAKALVDDGLTYWARTLADRIKQHDPTALVSVGYFTSAQGPNDLGRGVDHRLVDPSPLLTVDEIDFIDYHDYPGLAPVGWEGTFGNSFLTGDHDKPIVLGEVGAFRSAYSTVDAGITALVGQISDACRSGLDGFLGWVWDGQGRYDDTWNAVDQDGAIATALSPTNYPDLCDPPDTGPTNLALHQPATASLFEDTDEFVAPPRNAVDGSMATWWTAPDGGPQWIEVDLGGTASVERIRMLTDLGADTGLTVEIELLAADRTVIATHRFESPEPTPSLVLDHEFEGPVEGVAHVRATTFRDAWIIWNELEVHGRLDD